jgi:hypothetical protein
MSVGPAHSEMRKLTEMLFVYIATERVRPLQGVLRDWMSGGALTGGQGKGKGKEDWIGYVNMRIRFDRIDVFDSVT